jgi:hypothetical protein
MFLEVFKYTMLIVGRKYVIVRSSITFAIFENLECISTLLYDLSNGVVSGSRKLVKYDGIFISLFQLGSLDFFFSNWIPLKLLVHSFPPLVSPFPPPHLRLLFHFLAPHILFPISLVVHLCPFKFVCFRGISTTSLPLLVSLYSHS